MLKPECDSTGRWRCPYRNLSMSKPDCGRFYHWRAAIWDCRLRADGGCPMVGEDAAIGIEQGPPPPRWDGGLRPGDFKSAPPATFDGPPLTERQAIEAFGAAAIELRAEVLTLTLRMRRLGQAIDRLAVGVGELGASTRSLVGAVRWVGALVGVVVVVYVVAGIWIANQPHTIIRVP